jgi:brefeldin A-resistance guanine nucleotide exchange factor 1
MTHAEAARMSFELIETLIAEGQDSSLALDNFAGLLTVLDDFASSANNLQEQQQHRGRRAEPLSASKLVLPIVLSSITLICLHTSSPTIARGKKAVDLLPVLHKKLLTWVQSSAIEEASGKQPTFPPPVYGLNYLKPGNIWPFLC